MTYDLEKRLVIGLASSALYDLSEADKVFESEGEIGYREYQRQHQLTILSEGVAFSFIKCSGQLIPDTVLSFSSATAGAKPSLNWCGLTQL